MAHRSSQSQLLQKKVYRDINAYIIHQGYGMHQEWEFTRFEYHKLSTMKHKVHDIGRDVADS